MLLIECNLFCRSGEGDVLLEVISRVKSEDLESIRDFIREHEEVQETWIAEDEKPPARNRRETLINSLVYLVAFEEAGWATGKEKIYLNSLR